MTYSPSWEIYMDDNLILVAYSFSPSTVFLVIIFMVMKLTLGLHLYLTGGCFQHVEYEPCFYNDIKASAYCNSH